MFCEMTLFAPASQDKELIRSTSFYVYYHQRKILRRDTYLRQAMTAVRGRRALRGLKIQAKKRREIIEFEILPGQMK